ncbi:MAG: carboxypeptidase regulatory-like domain-containing protein [Williamsia sp.]|nr:carboxypeptidase regulatory-like domain-containing protein [Williamsia sp.]
MNRIYQLVCLLLFSVFLLQCRKELSYIGSPDPDPVVFTPEPLTATLQGNITDENNQPAAGVAITAGTQTALTNSSGYFRITGAALDKNSSVITAEKAGYFKGYRVFSATAGTNQVAIKLIKRNLAGSVSASSGGSATLPNGSVIKLPANGIVTAASGAAATGDVKVYASYIDPRAADISQTIPGSFAANDKNGKRVVLSSFGMLAVELESGAGQKLQIKQGASATLTVPIPAAALATAPATIPLWYVDEQTGLWKEEGSATRQGNNYVGDVAHFSYWNCDRPFTAVSLSLTLHNAKGLPLVHVNTRVTVADSVNAVAYGTTDSLGNVKGLVPANKNLLLEVLDPCGNAVYSQSINALTSNKELGVITVSNTGSSIITLSGKLLNCNGQAVTKGYAIISYNNILRMAATDANGQYTTNFVVCSGTLGSAQVIGVDQTSQQQSAASSVSVVAPGTDAGSITACGVSSVQTISYTLDGTAVNMTTAAGDSLVVYRSSQNTVDPTIYFNGMLKSSPTSYISFSVKGVTAPGTYSLSSLGVNRYNTTVLKQPFTITFTSVAKSVGELYEGSFSGQFTADSNSTVHTINTTFKVRLLF